MADTSKLSHWTEIVIRIILAAFFIAAGVLKIQDPKSLTAAIETYQVLPYSLSVIMALFMPWVELFAGLGVLFKKLYGGSLLLLSGLLLLFTVALLQGWIRGLDVTCGCFGNNGHENETNYVWLVLRDLLLLSGALTLWIRHALMDRQR